MRVKQAVADLLTKVNIPRKHAEKLQGQEARYTGFSTVQMVECEFDGAVIGLDTPFVYLLPASALEPS